ncbi:hypothetical protein [Microbacterium hydrocarbonoxydans]|uniref:hypothetical protein n=1 Tax=Microbacterium hydrocarbonoxydans TaxID=273678 RepID=UPI0013D91143|nr:hypothetical protein [Microbacterium hydrocarbonoxydans]
MTEVTGLGGHDLPLRLHGPGEVFPRRRRRRIPRGAAMGIVAAAAVLAAAGAAQLGANLTYDQSARDYVDAAQATSAALAEVRQRDAVLGAGAGFAESLLAGDSGILADRSAAETLRGAIDDAAATSSSADDLLADDIPDAGAKPGWFWELFSEAARLSDARLDVERREDDLDAVAPEIAQAADELDEAGITLLSSAATAAAGFEAAHLSARNDDVIALRDAAAAVADTATIDQVAVDAFTTLEGAAAQVIASEQAELAEKAGPLQAPRLEIEAFARSLAPGVLLEFDWNPIVNGAGANGSMGGLTTWWWDDPDRAVIELSNSVAEQWPSDRSRSLVAHEVGHAISVKCEDLYDSSTQDSIEKWATAWAISMGFTDDANGVWAYGYPPQSYIDAAYGCR